MIQFDATGQMIFNLIVGVAAFFGGYVLNSITKTLERLDTDLRQTRESYVSKEDYKDDLRRIGDNTRAIFDKLDGKADKSK